MSQILSITKVNIINKSMKFNYFKSFFLFINFIFYGDEFKE